MRNQQFTLINRLSEIVNTGTIDNKELEKVIHSISQLDKFKHSLTKQFCEDIIYEKISSYLESQFNIHNIQITRTKHNTKKILFESGNIVKEDYHYVKLFTENVAIHVHIDKPDLTGYAKMALNTFFEEIIHLIYIHIVYSCLKESATTDPLTNLQNRLSFSQEMKTLIPLALRENMKIGLMIINIDRFTAVNDEHGNEFGDEFLKLYAKTLKDIIRTSDIAVRFGGGEFLVLLNNVGTEEKALEIADKIRDTLAQTYLLSPNGDEFKKTVTIGVSIFPDDSIEIEEVMNNANIALTEAQALGRNRVLRFKPDDKSTIDLF